MILAGPARPLPEDWASQLRACQTSRIGPKGIPRWPSSTPRVQADSATASELQHILCLSDRTLAWAVTWGTSTGPAGGLSSGLIRWRSAWYADGRQATLSLVAEAAGRSGHIPADLESVLGATPQEFESLILRHL
jgi:hypothetical protein